MWISPLSIFSHLILTLTLWKGAIIILRTRKVRHGEAKRLGQGYRASRWRCHSLNPDCLPTFSLYIILPQLPLRRSSWSPCHRIRQCCGWVDLTQGRNWGAERLRTQREGVMGHSIKVTARKRAKGKNKPRSWTGEYNRMEEYYHDAGSPPRSSPSLCVLGRSGLSLLLHSFICPVRGWSQASPILTFQRWMTWGMRNGYRQGRREQWALPGEGEFWAILWNWFGEPEKCFKSLIFKLYPPTPPTLLVYLGSVFSLRLTTPSMTVVKGCLAALASSAHDSWSEGCEFKPHTGRRPYLKKIFLNQRTVVKHGFWIQMGFSLSAHSNLLCETSDNYLSFNCVLYELETVST